MSDTLTRTDLQTLHQALLDQNTRKLDIVCPTSTLRADAGQLLIAGSEPVLTPEGVDIGDGTYDLSPQAVGQLATRLDIPVAYLRKCLAQRPAIFDANANGWLAEGDTNYLVRILRPVGGHEGGTVRAVLSDSYKILDHTDALFAALEGIESAGVPVNVTRCDLTERRMYLKLDCPQIAVAAPLLLHGYRSPYSGQTAQENPLVNAGLTITNSETGHGQLSLAPTVTVQICSNGATFTEDAFGRTHLGAKLAEGPVSFSDEVRRKNLALVRQMAAETVRAFLSPEYVAKKVRQMEKLAGVPVEDAPAAIKKVGLELSYGEEQQKQILNRFIAGGQTTAGGVGQALTAAAQEQDDPDEAYRLEADFMAAVRIAARG